MRWAPQRNCVYETQGANPVGSRGVLLTANSSAGVKGGWVNLGSAMSFDYQSIWVAMANAGAGAGDFVIDIGLSDGTNRAVIMPNLRLAALAGSWTGGCLVQLPLFIPKGAQLSARCAASAGSRTCHVAITGSSIGIGGVPGYAFAEQGYTVASARGHDLDPTTADTMTGWTQLGNAYDNHIDAVLVAVGPGGQVGRTIQRAYLLDIGRGSVGNEAVIISGLQLLQAIDDQRPLPGYLGPFPVSVGQNSRIHARCQTTEITSTERKLDVACWGFVR